MGKLDEYLSEGTPNIDKYIGATESKAQMPIFDKPLMTGVPKMDEMKAVFWLLNKAAKEGWGSFGEGQYQNFKRDYENSGNNPGYQAEFDRRGTQVLGALKFFSGLPEMADQFVNPEVYGTSPGEAATGLVKAPLEALSKLPDQVLYDLATSLRNVTRGAVDVRREGGYTGSPVARQAIKEQVDTPEAVINNYLMAEGGLKPLMAPLERRAMMKIGKDLYPRDVGSLLDRVNGLEMIDKQANTGTLRLEDLRGRTGVPLAEMSPLEPKEATKLARTFENDVALIDQYQAGDVTFDVVRKKMGDRLNREYLGKIAETLGARGEMVVKGQDGVTPATQPSPNMLPIPSVDIPLGEGGAKGQAYATIRRLLNEANPQIEAPKGSGDGFTFRDPTEGDRILGSTVEKPYVPQLNINPRDRVVTSLRPGGVGPGSSLKEQAPMVRGVWEAEKRGKLLPSMTPPEKVKIGTSIGEVDKGAIVPSAPSPHSGIPYHEYKIGDSGHKYEAEIPKLALYSMVEDPLHFVRDAKGDMGLFEKWVFQSDHMGYIKEDGKTVHAFDPIEVSHSKAPNLAGVALGAALTGSAIWASLNDDEKRLANEAALSGMSGILAAGLIAGMGRAKPTEAMRIATDVKSLAKTAGETILKGAVDPIKTGGAGIWGASKRGLNVPIRAFEALGPGFKEAFYHPVIDGLNIAGRESKPAQVEFRNLLKKSGVNLVNYGKVSERIATYAIAQQKNGPEILTKMGKTVPELTPREMALYDHMRAKYEELYTRINAAREFAGLPKIGKVENYFTFARAFEDVREAGKIVEGSSLFTERNLPQQIAEATAASFTQHRGKFDAKLQLDAFGTFESYMNSSIRHIHLTPILAEQARLVKSVYGSGDKQWTLKEKNPGAYENLVDWINYQAGYRNVPFGKTFDQFLQRVTSRLVASRLSFNISSAVLQPTSYLSFAAKHGARWATVGLQAVISPDVRRQAMEKSSVLFTREHDITAMRGVTGTWGTVSRGLSAASEFGMAPLKYLDLYTAEATWWGAYQKALRELKMGEKSAIKYADEQVTKTQGSASTADTAPIQRTAIGKALTAYQTFTINNWGFLTKDLVEGTHSQKVAQVSRYIVGSLILNAIYESAGFNGPIPNPISGAISAAQKKDATGWDIAKGAAGEMMSAVPIVGGGFKFGSSPFGAVAQLGYDVTHMKTPKDAVAVGGGLSGIPGTGQAVKVMAALEKSKKNTKKSKWRK